MLSLNINHLTYIHKTKTLLNDLCLTLQPGCLYLLIGTNGSGKTTLIKAIAGLLSPYEGSIIWGGQDLSKVSRIELSRLVSYVPTPQPLSFDFTVEEFVSMSGYACARPSQSAFQSALKDVDLIHMKKRSVASLSSGEKQRVYIARALASCTPIILLDEPLSFLDIEHQLQMWQLFQRLSYEEGKLVLIAHHDLRSILEQRCQLLMMNEGSIAAHHTKGCLIEAKDLIEEHFKVSLQKDPNQLSFNLITTREDYCKVPVHIEEKSM